MYCHRGTNNRALRSTFTDPCKSEVRPGARDESASLACRTRHECLRHNESVLYGGFSLNVDRHYIGSVTATTHQEKKA